MPKSKKCPFCGKNPSICLAQPDPRVSPVAGLRCSNDKCILWGTHYPKDKWNERK